MPERFGDTLRRTRQEAEKTLGDVARLLGVSVVYVSDVERGNRRPFSNERILKVARLLEADPAPLIAAADVAEGCHRVRHLQGQTAGGQSCRRPCQRPGPWRRHGRPA